MSGNSGLGTPNPTGIHAGEHFVRLISWHTSGRFTDEITISHVSNHRFSSLFWEVLNLVDARYTMAIEDYTIHFDDIISVISPISPSKAFVALVQAQPRSCCRWLN